MQDGRDGVGCVADDEELNKWENITVVSAMQSLTENDVEATLDWTVRQGLSKGMSCKLRPEW